VLNRKWATAVATGAGSLLLVCVALSFLLPTSYSTYYAGVHVAVFPSPFVFANTISLYLASRMLSMTCRRRLQRGGRLPAYRWWAKKKRRHKENIKNEKLRKRRSIIF
jgi:hypothetical protein